MRKLPPSFVGTLLATIVTTGYVVVLDEEKFHLWQPLTRWVIMGGASLVLITYSVSWFFLESYASAPEEASTPVRGDYLLRLIAQTLLGLALAAVGLDLGLFLFLFVGFIGVSFFWTVLSYRSTKSVFPSELANFVLCILYAALAYKLYDIAHNFELSYPAISADKASLKVRVDDLTGQLLNPLMLLCLVVGMILTNLVVLLARSPWVRSALSKYSTLKQK